MKKTIILFIILILAVFLSGCSYDESQTIKEEVNKKTQIKLLITDNEISKSNLNKKELKNISIIENKTKSNIRENNKFPKKFHINGNKILDENNNQVILKGVNILDPLAQATWGEEAMGVWNEDYYKNMKKYGAKIIRIPIHPNVWRDTEKRFEILDKTLEWIENQEMYAIIDYHSIGFLDNNKYETDAYKTNKKEIKEFWKSIARRYGKNDVLIFYDLFNEPTNLEREFEFNSENSKEDWIIWKRDIEEIVDVIREVDNDSIIMVGGLMWSYDLTQVLENPINRDGIIYSIHPYPGKTDYLSWDDAFGKVADKYPTFAGEIGFWSKEEIQELTKNSQYDPDTYNSVYIEKSYTKGVYRDEIFKYLKDKNIGWTAWHFSPTWGPMLLKNWNYDLTEAGEVIKKELNK